MKNKLTYLLKNVLFIVAIFFATNVFSQAPTISSFTPSSGSVGTLVTITGNNLSTPTGLTIGGVSAIAVSNTGTSLVAMVMPGATTGTISVTTAGGSITSSSNFTITPTPMPNTTRNIQQGNKLVGNDNTGTALQGYAVSISADGNTAIIGGGSDNTGQGAAWVYIRSGEVWSQQGDKLVGTGNTGAANQGISVSISADGNTAIIGGNADNTNQGAAWIFTRSGGVWTQQGNKLVGTGNAGAATQGTSVSISADGNTVLVGGNNDNTQQGAAWVYTRSGGVWSQQGSKLVGTGNSGAANQGVSVSISADGNTAIVGGRSDNTSQGAAWVYTRSGGVWTQQGSKLVGTGSTGAAQQGFSVSISANGNTAIVGGRLDNTSQGAAWVFTRSGGVWSQQGNKLVGTGYTGASQQGYSVSLSADGNTAIIGGSSDNTNQGAAWVFTRNSGVWNQQGRRLVGTGNTGGAQQGFALSISADGNTAIVGGYVDNSNHGAAWVFVNVPISPPTITSFSPSRGSIGNLVTITGTNLGSSTALTIDGVGSIIVSSNDSTLVAMVMPGTNNGVISVTTALGTANTANNFSVTPPLIANKQLGNLLVGTGVVGIPSLGSSLCISADGNTAVVGGPQDNTNQGAAWIYTRTGFSWAQQGSKLVGTGNTGAAQQGSSVSISADGNTVIVGGSADDATIGAVWIYTRTGSTWTQQGNKLVGTGAVTIGGVRQGQSVSISADGNTAIVGGWADNTNQGAAWVFTRTEGNWTQQGNKLVGTGNTGAAQQGRSVSISADGNTAIVGGSADNTNQGAVWIYTRSGGVWSQQGSKLVGTGNSGVAIQGNAVSISADGNTAIVGGSSDNTAMGAVWIYTRSGNTWTQQGNKLVGTGAVTSGSGVRQGSSVSISADGNTVIFGANADNTQQGAAWIFTRSGGVWTQQGNKLVGTGNTGTAQQGVSVSISADGSTAIVGGSSDNGGRGATWVYFTGTPVITVISPSSGSVGSLVTISGFNFNALTALTIGGVSAIPISNNGSTTVAMVMPGATTGAILVSNSFGTGNNLNNFTVTPSQVPIAQQGNKLVGTGNTGAAQQGYAVSISADGNTAIVGGNQNSTNQGAAWIYTRTDNVWAQQSTRLIGTGNTGAAQQGCAVSISADGNTAIVGGMADNTNRGAAWIFIRNGINWSQQGTKLVGTGFAGASQQGISVSLSADGNTAIVGGNNDNTGQGAAWVFTRSGVTWTQQGSKLVGTGNSGAANQGSSVSISADATTAIIGGSGDNTLQGAAWVFTRSGSVWSQQGSKLVGTGNTGAAQQGSSVSIAADGNTAIVGGSADNTLQGAAWIFTRSGGVWSQQGNKLVGTDNTGAAQQGGSVSLSADGNTAIVGGSADNTNQGASWVYTRSAGVWSQQGNKIVGIGNLGSTSRQGQSLSISADGNYAIIGGMGDNSNQGAAWAFATAKLPAINSFTPSSGAIGTIVSISGTNLNNLTTLTIGGVSAIPVSNDGSTLVAMVMPGSSSGAISITTVGGTANSVSNFTITSSQTPGTQIGNNLVGTGGVGNPGQGQSLCVSADGKTAIIGGPFDNTNQGAAWIFTLIGDVWIQQGNKLVGTGNLGAARQGISVGISADGNTAIVGGNWDNTNQGAAWIFTRSGGVWTQQGNKLVGTGNTGAAQQGISVSISADGNTAIVGGSADNSSQGAAWVFTRTVGVWTQQGNKLVGTGNTGAAQQGVSVSIAADGNTAIVGGSADNSNLGAVWIFSNSGGTWSQQGNRLVGSLSVGASQQGTSVSISANGNTAIVGGPMDNSLRGAAWIFTRNGSTWSQQSNKQVGTELIGSSRQGRSVSISADGNTAIVGGNTDNTNQGAVWVFTRNGSSWSQQGNKLVGTGNTGAAQQGISVSLNATGNTAFVGGIADNTNQGASWVFSFVNTPSISSFSPALGTVGSLVTISGSDLDNLTSVTLGGVAVVPVSNDGNNLVAMVMPGTSGGFISVTTLGGTASSLGSFTVLPSIQPSLQQGNKLVGTGNTGAAQQGQSISISADGNTAIIGGNADNTNQGAAWIFTRNEGVWTQQGNKLVGTGNSGAAQQGVSVSISADGNTAIVGGSADNTNQGAAWIFTRSEGVWTQQGNKLVGTGNTGAANQGSSVSISADGNTAIIGGNTDNTNQGAAWIFTRIGGVWTQQGNKLVGTGNAGAAQQGSVSISADGNTAILGGSADNTNQGAVWIFTRSGGVWTQQGNKLVGTGNVGPAGQGNSVSISADGNTAIVGGRLDNSSRGAVWIYSRSGSTWTQQGNKLETGIVEPSFGSAVSISANGNIVIVGSPNANVFRVFTRKNGLWSLINAYAGTGNTGAALQGFSVSISADGKTAIVGGRSDNTSQGAAWVFVAPTVNTPTISSFSPNFGPIGTLITISGTGLNNLSTLTIGGVAAIPITNTPSTLVAMVMPGATTGSISVNTAGGMAIGSGNFTVIPSLPPTAQEGNKLVGTGNTGAAQQGLVVSVSADGNTAIVGGSADNTNQGAAWIYTRSGGIWTQQGSKLVGTGNTGIARQGTSVSISANGNTAIVGGSADNTNQGAVWIFTRSGSTWTQQGNKLVGTGNTGNAQQGTTVSISADGNTAIVGGPNDNSNLGAVWIFTRNGSTWSQRGNKLVGTGNFYASSNQGSAIGISADGNTAVVGGDQRFYSWIFTNIGGNYIQQGSRLLGGYSGSISADGNTIIVGNPTDNSNQGAALIYTRSGSTWTQQGNKLVGTGNTGTARQGSSVSISADGNTAIVGGEADNTNQGAIWVYTRSGGVWTQQGNKVVGTGNTGAAFQGRSVSISADGNTAIVGGNADNTNQGAAWVYKITPSNNADLSALLLSSGTLSPAFASNTTAYTASTMATSITVTPTRSEANATIQARVNNGSYTSVTSGSASAALSLNLGINTIDVTVTAQDLSTIKTYTITVTREPLLITWTGATSNEWNLADNWNPAQIPTNIEDVLIATSSNNPVLSITSAVRNITINSGANLTVSGILQIGGNLSTSGTLNASNGALVFNGSTAQTANPNEALVQNLTINNAAGVTLTGALNLTGILTPTSGVLTTGGFLTLKSFANNSASIASNVSGSNYISGNVTVERFVSGQSNRGRWRFLSSPVSNATVASWMTHFYVTGPGDSLPANRVNGSTLGTLNTNGWHTNMANILFPNSTMNSNVNSVKTTSIRTYNESVIIGDINSGWENLSSSSQALTPGKGFRAFIRGDISAPNAANTQLGTGANSNIQGAVNLTLTGTVNQGEINANPTFNPSGTINNDGWNLIGNPYACSYNLFAHITAPSNSAFFANISPTVYVYNARTNGYVSFNTAGGGTNGGLDNGIVPPGAAFFIKANSANPVFKFQEAYKTTNNHLTGGVHKTGIKTEEFGIKYFKDSTENDYTVIKMYDGATLNNDIYDIVKVRNDNLNLAAYGTDSVNLTATVIPPVVEETRIKLNVEATQIGTYNFDFTNMEHFEKDLTVNLFDRYTNKTTDVRKNTKYTFEMGPDSNQWGNNRFELILNKNTTSNEDLSNIISKTNLVIYPNPASNVLNINISNTSFKNSEIVVYNIAGTEVLKTNMASSNAQLNIEALSNGVYLINVSNENGFNKTVKFVK